MTVSAKIIADSINPRGTRITTFELIYPRIVHSELMTHRMFSRNSASSRAIPGKTMLELIESDPAMPEHWGKNQSGMQASEELSDIKKAAVKALWLTAVDEVVAIAKVMNDLGAHKQVSNRITEFAQHMKVVVTATDGAYENWFWLRDHKEADPTIAKLASEMKVAYDESEPESLEYGQWHLPYVKTELWYNKDLVPQSLQKYYDEEGNEITIEQALMISASCCAQVSYRKSDGSLEKAEVVFKRLIDSEPVHASPVEHQAMCFDDTYYWPVGTTHRDKEGTYYSGNLKDWIQYRQLIPNNAKGSWKV